MQRTHSVDLKDAKGSKRKRDDAAGRKEDKNGVAAKKDKKRLVKKPKLGKLKSKAPEDNKKIAETKAPAQPKKPASLAVPSRVPMGSVSSNWKALSKTITKRPQPAPAAAAPARDKKQGERPPEKPNAPRTTPTSPAATEGNKDNKKGLPPSKFSHDISVTKYIALDCEMVGVGIEGEESMLARVCLVNSHGNIIYDKHVKPRERIVDYRTKWSGIRPENLKEGAVDFDTVQKEVAVMVKGRIVVGHALENDFRALLLDHPFSLTRDTAKYRPFQKSRGKPNALRHLAKKLLGVDIQTGEHEPDEDARTALLLYKFVRKEWEAWLKRRTGRLKKKAKKKEQKLNALADGSQSASSTEKNGA